MAAALTGDHVVLGGHHTLRVVNKTAVELIISIGLTGTPGTTFDVLEPSINKSGSYPDGAKIYKTVDTGSTSCLPNVEELVST